MVFQWILGPTGNISAFLSPTLQQVSDLLPGEFLKNNLNLDQFHWVLIAEFILSKTSKQTDLHISLLYFVLSIW